MNEQRDEVKLDLDEHSLEELILAPYRSGGIITINGRSIPVSNVLRIRITFSDDPSSEIAPLVRQELSTSRVVAVGGPSIPWRVAARAEDVTDQFITGPPGMMRENLPSAKLETIDAKNPSTEDRSSVFLVAGRDNVAVSAVVDFVRSLGLRVIEWEHAVARTGEPNPYVGKVVTTGMEMAVATLVLLTPDDVVELRADLLHDDDGLYERQMTGQARPNVFYEAGIADALGKERTVIVEVGQVKPFSDVAGRHVIRFDGSDSKRNALAERLRIAGLLVDTSGSDWLRAGNVAGAIAHARTRLVEHIKNVTGPSEET